MNSGRITSIFGVKQEQENIAGTPPAGTRKK